MIASVHARPAEGPITSPESTETLTSCGSTGPPGSIDDPEDRAGRVSSVLEGER